jgi:hypothetical protein
MKGFIFITLIFLFACGGTLSEEQRKKLKEGMERNTIKKVSDARLTEAAFDMGRMLAAVIEKSSITDRKRIDSLQRASKVRILLLQPGDSMLLEIERQIVQAYTAGSNQITLNDNVQSLGADSLLYTKPVMKQLPNGAVEFSYALGIHLPTRQVILSINDQN